MRKIQPALLAGAVVLGLGVIGGLAAFVPSFAGSKSVTHEMTIQLPSGGTAPVAYAGSRVPQVTFHPYQGVPSFMTPFPTWGEVSSFPAFDPVIVDFNKDLEKLANTPWLIPHSMLASPLHGASSYFLPGTSYSMVWETIGNGVCTRFTQTANAPGEAKPKVVSQNTSNCRSDSKEIATGRQAASVVNMRSRAQNTTTRDT